MRNLRAEMERYGVTVADIRKILGCSEKTVRNKINGDTDFTLPEAFKIKSTFFKGYTLEYLFATDTLPESAKAG